MQNDPFDKSNSLELTRVQELTGGLEVSWQEVVRDYAQPDSLVDIGNMYWFAAKFHKENQKLRQAVSVLREALEELTSIDDGNEIGLWERSGYELNGETVYRADLVKSDLKRLRSALTSTAEISDEI